MNTTIKYLGELEAMRAVGMRSLNRHVYSVQGDRTQEVIDWLESQTLFLTATANWDQGQLMSLYVLFDRAAETEQRIKQISDAHTVFHLAFKGVEGFDWQGPKKPILADKASMRRAMAS